MIQDGQNGEGASLRDHATHEQNPSVSAVPAGIANAVVLCRADDPEKRPLLYACPKCGSVHSPSIYMATSERAHQAAREAAENCYTCKTHNMCACGAECSKYYTACPKCRLEKRLASAEEVPDNGGPYCVFDCDIYYSDLEQAYEDGIEWVSPCEITYPRIDPDDIFDNLVSNMHEDASEDDLAGVQEFRAAVEAFNKAQTAQTWWGYSKRKINVAKAMEARQGQDPQGLDGDSHDSALGNADLPNTPHAPEKE